MWNGTNETIMGGKKNRALPVQGYNEFENGTLVKHTNKTVTDDWGKEFGEPSGHNYDISDICKEYPDNEWCRMHLHAEAYGYRSGACGRWNMNAMVAAVALAYF